LFSQQTLGAPSLRSLIAEGWETTNLYPPILYDETHSAPPKLFFVDLLSKIASQGPPLIGL